MIIYEPDGIDYQGVVVPGPDRFAVEARNDDVRIGMLASIQIDHAHAIHKAADHENRRWLLHHRDRPYASHDDRQTSGPAVPDVVLVGLAFHLRLFVGVIFLL